MKGQTHGGKGSTRRKPLISQDQIDRNWEIMRRNNEKARKEAEKAKKPQ